jgi:hypothetical protein
MERGFGDSVSLIDNLKIVFEVQCDACTSTPQRCNGNPKRAHDWQCKNFLAHRIVIEPKLKPITTDNRLYESYDEPISNVWDDCFNESTVDLESHLSRVQPKLEKANHLSASRIAKSIWRFLKWLVY